MNAATLVSVREAAGLTQAALAARSKVSRATIANLERGANANPTLDVITKLAVALGVTADVLLAEPTPQARRRRASSR